MIARAHLINPSFNASLSNHPLCYEQEFLRGNLSWLFLLHHLARPAQIASVLITVSCFATHTIVDLYILASAATILSKYSID